VGEGETQDPDQQQQLEIGPMIMAIAATMAMNVIGPRLKARTESQSVALFFRPLRLMLMTGIEIGENPQHQCSEGQRQTLLYRQTVMR
jgi:hypothetical protein